MSERLMRPLGIEAIAKPIKASLLGRQGPTRGTCGLGLERAMHALVPTILFRMRRLDELGLNAEPDPPDRERGEATEGTGSKGRAVIGADPLG